MNTSGVKKKKGSVAKLCSKGKLYQKRRGQKREGKDRYKGQNSCEASVKEKSQDGPAVRISMGKKRRASGGVKEETRSRKRSTEKVL